ncbi:class I SAM-dependent methyltransferase [Coleofasciculus sp. FACHB-64]|uniref:class I SAM-dependent methyltransferase n=1 Tax=Cyanophyceae TaxID=3028117 RepID=UPI001686E3B4|nr:MULTISPECIES: class I SAM-dependent methyltransferase [unclassified Coleofasciculus]MBD1840934.1 class I SAM-dependent methyltransferase [Coleofasciculus sp. FACHB-501]MBD1889374.1 class I SAM-dependent methyltransferase [Coleofasciculus sp. FACHB-SPT9]MBD2046057.1 class I SAM-dependent methyltransferase [Coleofasciculus sp. FACHB-64]
MKFANGAIGIANLNATMLRCGVTLNPEEFIRIISNTYHAIEAESYDDTHIEITQFAKPFFKEVLLQTLDIIPHSFSVLDLGCGTGYALQTLLEICPKSRLHQVMCSDLSSDMVVKAQQNLTAKNITTETFVGTVADLVMWTQPFDMVLTNSVLHHIADIESFLANIASLVKPGGVYVMGHEPSSRFMANPECRAAYERWQTLRTWRRRLWFIDPLFYKRVLSKWSGHSQPDILQKTSDKLLRTGVITKPLTPREVRMMVDIHAPCDLPGDFCLGLPGFDPLKLGSEYLPGFHTICWRSYNAWIAPAKWAKTANALNKKFSLDGGSFTAAWQRDRKPN